MPRLSSDQVHQFNKDGYLHLRQVFSTDEIDHYREKILRMRNSLGFNIQTPLINYDEFVDLPFDDRLLDVAKSLLGDTVIYFGDSSVSGGPTDRGLHRDSTDRYNFLAADWESESYPLIRFGIYIGDFENGSGGLKLVPGSHQSRFNLLRKMLLPIFKERIHLFTPLFDWYHNFLCLYKGGFNVPSRSGDLIVWNFRTLHSARAARWKKNPNYNLPAWIEDMLPLSSIESGVNERMVLFNAYARPSEYVKRYFEKRRRFDLHAWRKMRWDSQLEAKAKSKGITLQKPWPETGQG
jgi:hypothetical protein